MNFTYLSNHLSSEKTFLWLGIGPILNWIGHTIRLHSEPQPGGAVREVGERSTLRRRWVSIDRTQKAMNDPGCRPCPRPLPLSGV
ncbi:hypothetical protein [Streptomyces sp. NPDC029003]|uniref:hypothetical protein n=1 Tax=Streptomyces sp. NPDC029003 TaxID=3155125 RepID=UPI0033DB548A